MNKNVVFLVLLIFMLSGISGEVPDNNVTISFERPNYVLSQTELPIFQLITPEVNKAITEDKARDLFDFPELQAMEVEGEGLWVVNYQNQTFDMDSKDGSIWYADMDKIWNIKLGNDIPSPYDCEMIATDWLEESNLLPDNAAFSSIGSTNISAVNVDTEEQVSKIIQYHVNYGFYVGEIPIAGESEQISVIVGGNGSIVGLDWNYRAMYEDPIATYNLIEFESSLAANEISPDDVASHRLIYKTDDDPNNNDVLIPMWEVEIVEEEIGESEDEDVTGIIALVYIEATQWWPAVEIITPEHEISVSSGTSLKFDCHVFGTPPYTYEWRSDFDGVLSSNQSFSTTTLSEVLKEGTPVPHAISVKVWDSDTSISGVDCIAVTIEPSYHLFNPTLVLVAVGSIGIFIGASLVCRKRKGRFALLLLVMMFSAFLFLPVSYASSEIQSDRKMNLSAPTGAYDDDITEMGIEWLGASYPNSPLRNTEENAENFYNWMHVNGDYSREFNWGEYSAWSSDFTHAGYESGNDDEWVDCVDFVYYQGHGNSDGVTFNTQHPFYKLSPFRMRLGDGDLETIVFDACKPLQNSGTGFDVYQRWSDTLQGVHQICSFATTSHNSMNRGRLFGLYLTGFYSSVPVHTIFQAWFRACVETEPDDAYSAIFYGSSSVNPLDPQMDDPSNDHIPGFGYVCSDPIPGSFSWYMYLVSNC